MKPLDSALWAGLKVAHVSQSDPLLSIGQFARKSRLSMKALRLYAKLGLLAPMRVDESNGYRWYRSSQLATARFIVELRRLEMPLNQVAEVLAAAGPEVAEIGRLRIGADATPAGTQSAADLLAEYWESVERRVASQRLLAAHLQVRLRGEQGRYSDMFQIQEREVPEQLVLTEQRHVRIPDLAPWIAEAIDRLMSTSQRFGGPAAPIFVIYHGEVNQDSDGPVEVCVPVSTGNGAPADVPARVEPAHHEAYVRITKAQVEFPQILSAYDAVFQWLTSQGRTPGGAPREVYFTDFMAAKPTDEVCDVAVPT